MCISRSDRLGLVDRELCGGRYRVVARFAETRAAALYRACDRHSGESVVVKVPLPELLASPGFGDRFIREMQTLVGISHPHIVELLAAGELEGVPFAVVQDVPGENLAERRPEGHEAMSWLRPAAEALDWLQGQGFQHTDLRPGNILFDTAGQVFIAEAGIIRSPSERVGHEEMLASTLEQALAWSLTAVPGSLHDFIEEVRTGRRRLATCLDFADQIEPLLESFMDVPHQPRELHCSTPS